MAVKFVDRQSTYPNRYKITRADSSTEYITLERADEPTVIGTPLNAETFNNMFSENVFLVSVKAGATSSDLVADKTYAEISEARLSGKTIRLLYGGVEYGIHSIAPLRFDFYPMANKDLTVNVLMVNSDDVWITGTRNLLLLDSNHYGDTLPSPDVPGRIFFKKVTE